MNKLLFIALLTVAASANAQKNNSFGLSPGAFEITLDGASSKNEVLDVLSKFGFEGFRTSTKSSNVTIMTIRNGASLEFI